ncbi:leishmanolysin-like peptidase 2 [Mugil cephalus]|uniref:leishmanolysin-like peptidase 2 n=1 Tax=Mugil cephalus TaxID=48193 RepID=UPI001FB6A8E6|nr:leishmanolysin-like peptidase 2 [Mugil cephalus]
MLLVVVVVLVVELPGALQKCIFDEVQAQIRVVRAAGGPPGEPRLANLTQREPPPISSQHTSHPRRPSTANQDPKLDYERGRQPIGDGEGKAGGGGGGGREDGVVFTLSDQRTGPTAAQKRRQQILQVSLEEFKRHQLQQVRQSRQQLQNRDLSGRDCEYQVIHVLNFPALEENPQLYDRCHRQIPDDHLAGCDVYPEADSPRRIVLRPEGNGVPHADYLLYLHVQATDKCRAEPSVLAYAVHCQTDAHGRPVAGVVVICRDRLTGATYSHQTTVQTVIHEVFHALGFSKDLFSTWRDCPSSSQGGAGCSPRGKVTHSDGSGQVRIYTPSIISALQEHLVSADRELGGPLENLDASPGRASSHWESRLLRGSIMAAVLGESTTVRIDPVTLAALQDTGWYAVNLSRAQSLVWGSGEGAKFGSLSTCQDNSSSFFCSGSGPGCHFLHLHKGECQTDRYLEGCRVYKPLKNGSECWKNENAKFLSAEVDWSGEIFGAESRCFFSSLIRQGQLLGLHSSVPGRCYRHRCTGPNRYQIQVVGSGWVDCPAGGSVQVKGYQGFVFCPDRRLCLYPDVKPPLGGASPFSACITCDPDTLTPTQNLSWHLIAPGHVVSTALCFTAAVCLVAALIVSYRKWRSWVIRINAVAPEDP